MPHATIDGVRIHHEVMGEGPALALCYCLGGNLTMLEPQARALASHYQVILWDPRGHGGSDSPANAGAYGIGRSAEDLAGLLDHLGIERAHVGGLSMGGGIAARFAIRYPGRARSLCILDSNTAASQPVAAAMREVREHAAALCDAGDMQAVARYFLAHSPAYRLFAGDGEVNRARLHRMIAGMHPVGFAGTLRAMLAPEGCTEDLAAITAPTLVVAGEHDPAMAAIRLTHESIPGSRLEVIPGAGHLSNIDAPGDLLRVVRGFLDRVDGST